jgi:hypothetical protein
VVIVEDDFTPPVDPPITLALAQLWFDGRTVDRIDQSVLSGGSLYSYVADQFPIATAIDPSRPWSPVSDYAVDHEDAYRQQVDSVWCLCDQYGMNIQFRLVEYVVTNSDVTPDTLCHNPANWNSRETASTCLNEWIAAAARPSPSGTINIVFIHHYFNSQAEAFPPGNNIVVSEDDFREVANEFNPQNTLAHEIGHILGGRPYHDPTTGRSQLPEYPEFEDFTWTVA